MNDLRGMAENSVKLCLHDTVGNSSTVQKQTLGRVRTFMRSMDREALAHLMVDSDMWNVVLSYPSLQTFFVDCLY